MNTTALLLNAYYEALHDLLVENKARLIETAGNLLREELKNRSFGSFNRNKYDAYLDACLAFIAERIEMYNPIGIQYTVDRIPSGLAQELELQLNFYDSRSEFQQLKDSTAELTQQGFSDEQLPQLAARLIAEHGAFPDKSIISAYQVEPTLNKLPDYITALSIENTIAT
jgi:chorismate mutase